MWSLCILIVTSTVSVLLSEASWTIYFTSHFLCWLIGCFLRWRAAFFDGFQWVSSIFERRSCRFRAFGACWVPKVEKKVNLWDDKQSTSPWLSLYLTGKAQMSLQNNGGKMEESLRVQPERQRLNSAFLLALHLNHKVVGCSSESHSRALTQTFWLGCTERSFLV